MLAVQLATKFLFQVGFRTKKQLRGPASDWYVHLRIYIFYEDQYRKKKETFRI